MNPRRDRSTLKSTSENERLLDAAIADLEKDATSVDAVRLLVCLRKHVNEPWLGPLRKEAYSYSETIYEDRRWSDPTGAKYPPGTTLLGVVLDNALEVSVVERLSPTAEYHRAMAIIPKGGVFGTFEAADLLSRTQPLQDYTVFSGVRTFFFEDAALDGINEDTSMHAALKGAVPLALSMGSPGNSSGELVADTSELKRKAEIHLNRWKQPGLYSPTQTPLEFMQAILGPAASHWKATVLLIEFSNVFLVGASPHLRQIIYDIAWRQSSGLRRSAIQSYLSDWIIGALSPTASLGRRKGSAAGTGEPSLNRAYLSSVARELACIPGILAEERLGFHRYVPQEEPQVTDKFGPFSKCIEPLAQRGLIKPKTAVYIAGLLYDRRTPLVHPVYPNCEPLAEYAKVSNPHKGGPRILKSLGDPSDNQSRFGQILDRMLVGDHQLRRDHFMVRVPENDDSKSAPCMLRGRIEINSAAPTLPLFAAVPNPGFSENDEPFAGVIAVQHLMEETLCLIEELTVRHIATPKNIWVLGKAYSTNRRIVHRLEQLGVHVKAPMAGWQLGAYDFWFKTQTSDFIAEALRSLDKSDHARPILLLDDGGALIEAATKFPWPGGYKAVEQTTRGLRFALEKPFPVVAVACSHLKSVVEPEFVVRAALEKMAHYYPEALRSKRVGVVGVGNIGRALVSYLTSGSSDVHHGARIVGADRAQPGTITGVVLEDTEAVFESCDVVYGCTGKNLGAFALRVANRGNKTFVSLTSGDVEFAKALASVAPSTRMAADTLPVRVGNSIITNAGFPITFDGAACSAPLIEMQLTRALLLAAIQQTVAPKSLSNEAGVSNVRPLEPSVQATIWREWSENYERWVGSALRDGTVSPFWQLNDVAQWLRWLSGRVGDPARCAEENQRCFNAAMALAAAPEDD